MNGVLTNSTRNTTSASTAFARNAETWLFPGSHRATAGTTGTFQRLINAFRVLRDEKKASEVRRRLSGTPYSDVEYRLAPPG